MKTAFVSMLLSTILGVTAAAAATSPFTFGTTTVSVKVTPHATTVWIANFAWTGVITDTDGDGIVTLDTGAPINPYALYVVADLTAGTVLLGDAASYYPTLSTPSNLVQLAPDGTLSRLVLPQRDASVLWMRPGVGAWRYVGSDAADDDGAPDRRTQVLATHFWAVPGGSPAPATFAPGDVIYSESQIEEYYHTATTAILETLPSPLVPPSGAGSVEFYGQTKVEGATSSLAFLRVNGADGTLSLDYSTADDTAKAGVDYQPISGTVTFGPGEFVKTIALSTIDDALYEGTRVVNIVTSIPVNPGRYDPATTTVPVQILDNDPAPVITCADLVAAEGDGPQSATFNVNLAGATRVPASMSWTLRVAGSYDPPLATGTLTFMPGETTKSVPVSWTGNTVPNYDRTLTLSLFNAAGCTIATNPATLTIKDDDPPTVNLAGDVATLEGPSGSTGAVEFTIELSAPISPQVTVDYRTVDGTAVAGKDYVATSGTLTFMSGLKAQYVPVSVIGNDKPEPDKTFTLVLSNPQHALLGTRPSATATIRNDDGAVVILTVLPITVAEGRGQSTATFTATLSAAATAVVHVDWHTVDGTALAGRDYVAASGSFDFRPGETTKVFNVEIIGNTIPQPDRTFSVVINAANVASFTPAATCHIVDDDSATPTVVISDASLVRGAPGTTSTLSATVQLSAPSSATVSVHYATSDGTAAASRDYIAAEGDLTFAAGQTMKIIPVTVNGSATTADETFTIVLSRPVNATLVDAAAKCTILAAKQTPPPELHHRAAHH